MASDIPPRQVLPDLALQGIAQREPTNLSDLAQSRGVDDRHTRGSIGQEILAAVARGKENPVEISTTDGDEVDRHLRPAITLISAWISEVARIEHVDTALLATRNDIVAYLRRDTDARLATGWRLDLIGEQLDDLLQGNAGLSFDGKGGLKMISAVPNVEPVGTKSA
jgi:ribonuclease D